jgi:hypothetical protein
MKKPRRQTLLTQIMKGGDLAHVGETTLTYQLPDAPDYLYIFSKEEHPHFLAFTTPEGLVYQCDGCHGLHVLFWHESDYAKAPEMPRHAPGKIRALWEELRDTFRPYKRLND